MKAVVQRVARAAVSVDGQLIAQIGRGLLVLLGIGKADIAPDADWMINKLLNLRIFPDDADKMNRSVTDIGGEILVVSQFTLYGDARNGTRPSFSEAMPPTTAEKFYTDFVAKLRAATSLRVAEGKFAAMMDVELINDGPVTIILECSLSVERASSPFKSSSKKPNGLEARSTPIVPYDPRASVAKHRRNLPHWQQEGRTYFVTFRLADSLPQEKLQQWTAERSAWLKSHPEPRTAQHEDEYRRLFTERLDAWLDAGHGTCWLRQPEVARVVEQALRHFDGDRYSLGSFVIMPNHVHALITPFSEGSLDQLLHSWKSYSANESNRRLGRHGSFWQAEYFDHLVRDEQALLRFDEYIRNNPQKAQLCKNEYIIGP